MLINLNKCLQCWALSSQFIIKLTLVARDVIIHKYFIAYHLSIFHSKNKSIHPSAKTCEFYLSISASDAFHIDFHICTPNQRTGFYWKAKLGWNWSTHYSPVFLIYTPWWVKKETKATIFGKIWTNFKCIFYVFC